MSALAESGLTASDVLAKMSAHELAALEAKLARKRMRDKSYLELPMGREVGRYLSAKRKELTASSARGWESCLEKLARERVSTEMKCEHCGQECGPSPGWTEEDAEREARETFGEIPGSDRAVICDDCWPEFLAWMGRTYGPGTWPLPEGESE